MIYLNPPRMTKEQFLDRYGRTLSPYIAKRWRFHEGNPKGEVPVCLVDNGLFTAAGAAPDKYEYKRWFDDQTDRPRTFWAVPLTAIREHCALSQAELEALEKAI